MRTLTCILTSCTTLWCVGCAMHSDPAVFVQHYMELHQSADVDGLLALHTADAEFLIPGQAPIRGAKALRDLFEWDAVLGSQLAMDSISAHGDTISVDSIIERNKWFQAMGLPEVRFKPGTRFVLRNGRIAYTYLSGLDDETQRQMTEQFEDMVPWLSSRRPDDLKRLLPGGRFRYDAASARLWLEVLDAWNSARLWPDF